MVEHGSNKPRVVGSSPTVTTFSIAVGFCSVMVITLDFESSDPGSNPGRTCFRSLDSPPWLSWQSARLLTDRSLVRAQVEAFLKYYLD